MGSLDLALQVLNISPKATREDLITFFSYCGTIDKVELQRDGDQSQMAVVTFRQPYAFQTALLLSDAIIADRRVHILPLENEISVPIIYCTAEDSKRYGRGFNPATEQAVVGGIESVITSKDCLSKGALWLTGILDKAAQSVGEMSNVMNKRTNSRK